MKITKAYSTIYPKLIERVGPKDWRVRWDIQEEEDQYSYTELQMSRKPSLEEIKDNILTHYNSEIDQKILSGFTWNDISIWLSSENQFNYKAAYDVAVQTGGNTLPVTFKFGTTELPVYYTFNSLEEISDFYIQALNYINTTLAEGWEKKDSFDFTLYQS